MKHFKSAEKNKFSLLAGMLLIITALLVTTKLVQQNQENRSNAATGICKSGERRCINNGVRCVKAPCPSFDTQTCVNGAWKKSGTCSTNCTKDGVCKKNTPTPTKAAECKDGEHKCMMMLCAVGSKEPCDHNNEVGYIYSCSNGSWKKSETCTYGCMENGVCLKKPTPTPTKTPVCKTGERRCVAFRCALSEANSTSTVAPCHDSTYTEICVNGVWKKGETCKYFCTKEGVCDKSITTPSPTKKPECKTGDKRCVDNGIRCVKAPCYSFDTQTCVNAVWKKSGTCSSNCTKDGVCKENKPVLNSKIAFYGIKAGTNINCISNLNSVSLEVVDITNNKLQTFSNVPITLAVGESNSVGDQIFQINNLNLDASIFKNSNTFLYIKIKGPGHLKQKMCINNQTKKINNNNGCNINLYDKNVYDFSNYSLLSGDINQDGIINVIDFSLIKNDTNTHDSSICGNKSDLNLDGFTNSVDLNLIKTTLSARNDE